MVKRLRYWILDVDGTLTDGGIYYGEAGDEVKKFNVKDGAGFALAHAAGMKIIVLTGRECRATVRRMKELRADFLFQNVKDKAQFLKQFFADNDIDTNEAGYIGDDLNDLISMRMVGFAACPFDACEEVKKEADYVASAKGGYGAVREIMEYVLKEQLEWESTVAGLYGSIGI
jgi:3-deoxy-D-manno-octulosonate 8-phosphate phosphatase (KDO 8-P phosphatase)